MSYNNNQQVFVKHVNIRKSLAYHMSTRITMHHVLKARITFTQHVTIVKNTRPMQNIVLVQILKKNTPYPRKGTRLNL